MDETLPDVTTSPAPDPYAWWVGKPVDIRVGGPGTWRKGEVLEASHDILFEMGSDRGHWYEGDIGESDGTARVIVLDLGSEPTTIPMYPGGPHGVLPNVVVRVARNEDIVEWWESLPAAVADELLVEPGTVPTSVVSDVARSGVPTVGTWWPDTQAGPDAFRLPTDHAAVVSDVALLRSYEVAQLAYDRMFAGLDLSSGPLAAVDPRRYQDAQRVIHKRDITKMALDLSRETAA